MGAIEQDQGSRQPASLSRRDTPRPGDEGEEPTREERASLGSF